MKKFFIVVGTLAVVGVVTGVGLLIAYPKQMVWFGALGMNYFKTWSAPPGTLTTESNPKYQLPSGTAAQDASAAPAATASAGEDWPSYNRTLSSDRYSPLTQINTSNVSKLRVLCTYDLGQFLAFETNLIMVNGSLIGTTDTDIFALDPATCALKWRTHNDIPRPLLPVNRGAAYLDGMLFQGTQDGQVFGFDFDTGKRLWTTTIADVKVGEKVSAAPIAWNGLVFIGNAGGDYKGGKGRMYALDAKSGKVVWQFFMTPRQEGEPVQGPVGASPDVASTWKNPTGIPISGGGLWTSFTLDTKTGLLYLPGGNPAPDFVTDARVGNNLFVDSVVVLDAKTGNYKHHWQLVPEDWHDWDVSNPPILIRSMGGKQLMIVAPKDGHLYAFDLSDNRQVFRVPATTIENADVPFASGKLPVHFCPGTVGGAEWNSPSYVPGTNLVLVGEVDWCTTATKLKDVKELQDMKSGAPWGGMAALNPIKMFGNFAQADGHWAGWVYAVDADSGVWKWRAKTNYPILAGMTPTAGGITLVGDIGGNFYALDSASGEKLWSHAFDGALAGGVITYVANDAQKVAVATGFAHMFWPTKIATAKIEILGLE
jgi:alcohol dehydrogenase (cytochrome c)